MKKRKEKTPASNERFHASGGQRGDNIKINKEIEKMLQNK